MPIRSGAMQRPNVVRYHIAPEVRRGGITVQQHDGVALSHVHVRHLAAEDPSPFLLVRKCRRDHVGCPFSQSASSPLLILALDAHDPQNHATSEIHIFLKSGKQCPLWVKSRHQRMSAPCPLYPQKRTLVSVAACPLCARR